MSWVSLGHTGDDICEVGSRIEAVELGGFEHGIDYGCTIAAGFGADEQIVFPRDGNAAQGAFGRVIVDADAAVSGIEAQTFPAAGRVVDGLDEIVLGGAALGAQHFHH